MGKINIENIDVNSMKVLEARDNSCIWGYRSKKPNSYLFEEFPKSMDSVHRVGIRTEGGIFLGYSMAGITLEGIGELAMVRVSPYARGIGIGSILFAHQIDSLLRNGDLSELAMQIADRSGRINHLADKYGFKITSHIGGIGGNSIANRRIKDNADRIQLLNEVGSVISFGLDRLSSLDLSEVSKNIEKMGEIPTPDELKQAISRKGGRRPSKSIDVELFGYPGAKCRLAVVAHDGKEIPELYLRGFNPDNLGSPLDVFREDFGLGSDYSGIAFRGKQGDCPLELFERGLDVAGLRSQTLTQG